MIAMDALDRSWPAFYRSRMDDGYLNYVKDRYRRFITEISRRIDNADRVLELGAGTATITRSLIDEVKSTADFIASDINPEMRRMSTFRLMGTSAVVCEQDAKKPSLCYNDIVHSHGLLEHFSDQEIRQIIREHKCARAQIHYVPGLYPYPTYGDERLMSVDEWRRICNPTEIITFNDGLDYILIWDRRTP